MHTTIRAMTIILLLCIAALPLQAISLGQDSQTPAVATGSVTGRVTVDGKATQGIIVILNKQEANRARLLEQALHGSPGLKAVTDEEGIFRFNDVPVGRYEVSPFAPALIASSESRSSEETSVINVADGKLTEGLNFALSRGGVITGRVTDAEGRPAIRETISLSGADDSASARPWRSENSSMMLTDYRGVYRIYGLPPGRYVVSAGGADPQGMVAPARKRNIPRTYHPSTSDKAKAKAVEITTGAEFAGIDIKLSSAAKGLYASGRIIDETGKPVPNAVVTFMPASEGTDVAGNASGLTASTGKGEFRFENIQPGKYRAIAQTSSLDSDLYAEPLAFEVKNEDVTGLEIKLQRGGSISGVVAFEGGADAQAMNKLTEIMLGASVAGSKPAATAIEVDALGSEPSALGFGRGKISADGSFRISGLSPGKASITTFGMFGPSELKLSRIEREGVEVNDGIEVKAGEHVTGVKLIFAVAKGVIHGKVIISGEKMPDGARIEVLIYHSATGEQVKSDWDYATEVDADGNFIIEGLVAGSYDIVASAVRADSASGNRSELASRKQTVIVTNDDPTEVSITLEIKKDR